jgi:hypothetical protein
VAFRIDAATRHKQGTGNMSDHAIHNAQDIVFTSLLRSAHELLSRVGDPTTVELLSQWPANASPRRRVSPCQLPVLAWIGSLERIAVPATYPLVSTLVAGARSLAWAQTYSVADVGARFLERYGWTELIGLRGPVASADIAAGFLLLGPDIEYPLHSHEAGEAYVPLAGSAKWKRGEGDWIDRPTGQLVHHASWEPHAMRTGREPLLALYVWRNGDLAQKSRILQPT